MELTGLQALHIGADSATKQAQYEDVLAAIKAVLSTEPDWVAAMATTSSLLHTAFEYYSWVGFYRAAQGATGAPTSAAAGGCELVVGPYQGSLGCTRIPAGRGVCGAAAAQRASQLVPDVHAFVDHIACASTTLSELVVPVLHPVTGAALAVLDVDSNHPAAFDASDQLHLEALCGWLADKYFGAAAS